VGASAAEAQAASVAQAPAAIEPVQQVQNDANLVTINFATDSYIPTNAMAENARRALDVREQKPISQRGMTSIGIARARDLMNKRPMSEDTVRRMKAFFDRHQADKTGETWKEQGKGWQAWHGWGGDEGYSWATAIVERLNKQEVPKELNAEPFVIREALLKNKDAAEVFKTFCKTASPTLEEIDKQQRVVKIYRKVSEIFDTLKNRTN
jgi:hypothetical protein